MNFFKKLIQLHFWRRHYFLILFFIFIAFVSWAGIIFWRYAYLTVSYIPSAPPKILKLNPTTFTSVKNNLEFRKNSINSIKQLIYPDIFR